MLCILEFSGDPFASALLEIASLPPNRQVDTNIIPILASFLLLHHQKPCSVTATCSRWIRPALGKEMLDPPGAKLSTTTVPRRYRNQT